MDHRGCLRRLVQGLGNSGKGMARDCLLGQPIVYNDGKHVVVGYECVFYINDDA